VTEVRSDGELDGLIEIAIRAAKRVGEIYVQHCASDIEVELKGPNDPVTAADREANAIIIAALATRHPEATIVAEETVPTAKDLLSMSMGGRVFFVDPLDGTREFVDKNPEFAVMIGIAEDGEALAGVVCMPMDMRVLAGRVGVGAFLQTAAGDRTPLSVTGCGTFGDARMMVSRSHRPPLIEPLCKRLGIAKLTPCGSAGVKIAHLAQGEAELYVHEGRGLKRWDSCAPEAILRAAGGRLSDLDGAPIDYTDKDLRLKRGLVASNTVLHPGVLSAVTYAERAAAK
jgi:3'(2'), 5'-bisphosphate nucleotidase